VIRRFIRHFRLQGIFEPVVGAIDDFLSGRLGSYQARRVAPRSLEIVYGAKSYKITGLGETFCDMGLSQHERPTITAVLACVSEGMIAWDVGANNGFYSCLLSRITGANGEVFAFEPNPDAFAELVGQLRAFHIENVRPLRTALGDSDGNAEMLVTPGYTPASRIVVKATKPDEKVLTICVRRGDSLINQGVTRQPSFIKLDVEGHELSALHGMQGLLSAPDLRAILCEIHFSILDQSGVKNPLYRIRRLLKDSGLVRQQWVSRSHLLARRPE
jgi:FkbM family methyltransferase